MNIIMNQILILTRNVLIEQEIQQKLQALNYEVYCSAKHFDSYSQQTQMMDLFSFFQYVILSETICESEVKSLVLSLKEYSLSIIRKVETNLTEMDKEYLETEQIHAIISNDDSIDELRECFHGLKWKQKQNDRSYQNEKVGQLSRNVSLIRSNQFNDFEMSSKEVQLLTDALHRLSPIESKVISILMQAGNQIVTREEICHIIWNENPTKSHLASLSSTITRIKNKFMYTNLESAAIQTLWGKGYKMNQKLLECIQNDQVFSRIVTND